MNHSLCSGWNSYHRYTRIELSDIASMSVLKDASSACYIRSACQLMVWCSSPPNGVEGKSTISFNAYYGVSDIRKTIQTLSTNNTVI
ncbi:MAG: hypothetical protein IPP15_23375 [Saprospiraceae bacterium]|uniref:Uncharacterized protein n=1 Tax=Candidatus Opimibacter skivensis TaxID=2982028 RepID=A0A9D7SXV3_9BACT|nr:hypothetical protein [Candidatus Opimibacter skivensis]